VETVFRVRGCVAGNTRPRPRDRQARCRRRARQQTPRPSHSRAGAVENSLATVVFLNARCLDPTLGGFMSVDPILDVTGDAYGYGNDNPITTADPTGLCSTVIKW
jgi:RHS repeat-associated protein